MTTDTKPTDAEIIALLGDRRYSTVGAVREAITRWGQPAHSGEPVAFIHWPVSGPPRLVWHSQKALNDAILKTYEGHQPDVKLYTAPQPVEREPLPVSQIRDWWAIENGLEDCEMCKLTDFLRVVRAVEEKHGIKGGQHGAE